MKKKARHKNKVKERYSEPCKICKKRHPIARFGIDYYKIHGVTVCIDHEGVREMYGNGIHEGESCER